MDIPMGDRRPSSPQAIPGLPLIEIRRPTIRPCDEFDFGVLVNSPEFGAMASPGSEASDCAPLLLGSGTIADYPGVGRRKSSDGMYTYTQQPTPIVHWLSREFDRQLRFSSVQHYELQIVAFKWRIATEHILRWN